MARGLFVGLIPLDCIYQVEHVPASNEKLVAQRSLFLAGGPATNAAVAFAYWRHQAVVLGGLGQHPITGLIRADLAEVGVEVMDLMPNYQAPPPISTILVNAATGDRAVVAGPGLDRPLALPAPLADLVESMDIILIDGHQMALGLAVAALARQRGIPVVIDAGSWKPGFEQLLPLATSVIAAASFRLPPQASPQGTRQALCHLGIPEVATSDGPHPIQYCWGQQQGAIAVPPVTVVDTLGAGDILHGAFCHYRLNHAFGPALEKAAAVAAHSCQELGTRAWRQRPDFR
ncbi:MAG TPA: sugar kinase [Leptolyngbyaceae cyanobacterium M65_K2018_010]|nr:sugar kinase [Leptolyngbyaceae cyanobacterium M65_K2018_010]